MHKRQQILEIIRQQIVDTNYFAGNVWIQNAVPKRAQYPCVFVVARNEDIQTETIHSNDRPQIRRLNVIVSTIVKGSPDDEKVIQDINNAAVAIEQKVQTDKTVMIDCRLTNIDITVDEEDAEYSTIEFLYSITYTTTERTVE